MCAHARVLECVRVRSDRVVQLIHHENSQRMCLRCANVCKHVLPRAFISCECGCVLVCMCAHVHTCTCVDANVHVCVCVYAGRETKHFEGDLFVCFVCVCACLFAGMETSTRKEVNASNVGSIACRRRMRETRASIARSHLGTSRSILCFFSSERLHVLASNFEEDYEGPSESTN